MGLNKISDMTAVFGIGIVGLSWYQSESLELTAAKKRFFCNRTEQKRKKKGRKYGQK
jgi:hypothetical protein